MISVIIPLYNKAPSIVRCITSVFTQTVLPDELIIINDGSKDNGFELAKRTVAIDSNISIQLIDQENSGVSYTRNKGISLARNKFVALLDADDEWHEQFIEEAINELTKHEDVSLYTCKHEVSDELIGRFIPYQNFGAKKSGLLDNYLYRARFSPIVNSSKVVINKKYFEKVGGFPLEAKVSEDLFLWLKMSECAPIAYSEKLLVTIYQALDNSRHLRVGEVPFPITYYAHNKLNKNQNEDLYLYLWAMHLNHVLGSCTSNKKEALIRIKFGIKLFKLKGAFLFVLLLIPKKIFVFLRFRKRLKMTKTHA